MSATAPARRPAAVPPPLRPEAGAAPARPRVLVLSSSLLVDRMLLHTGFLPELARHAAVEVWATSAAQPRFRAVWAGRPAVVRDFPAVRAFRETWHNLPRRLNEAVWDHRHQQPSRLSLERHGHGVPDHRASRALRRAGRALAGLPVHGALERALTAWLLAYDRSPEATARLRADPPAAVFTTGPFKFEQPALVGAAKRLGIPVLALIPSWDNLSTKKRMICDHDGYVVWSAEMRRQLLAYYPRARARPVYVVGAPQFDAFADPRFRRPRETFWRAQGLDPARPVVVYAVGSPNFLRGEPHGALHAARAVAAGALGNVQLLVRPHPIHDNAEMAALFGAFGPSVRLQRTAAAGLPLAERSQDEEAVAEWVNTFRHADVVVNLSSTCTVDAALCDRPVVNLDYDPGPGAPDQALVRDINHRWTHFAPVAESGGVWLVNDGDELLDAVRGYLADPARDRAGRRWIVEHVCEYADGRSGERMARAVADFAAAPAAARVRGGRA